MKQNKEGLLGALNSVIALIKLNTTKVETYSIRGGVETVKKITNSGTPIPEEVIENLEICVNYRTVENTPESNAEHVEKMEIIKKCTALASDHHKRNSGWVGEAIGPQEPPSPIPFEEEQKMEGMLAWRYRKTQYLPDDHPYKYRRPFIKYQSILRWIKYGQ